MAFLGIRIPSDIGNLLAKVNVPEKREPKDQYHITVLNFGDDMPMDQIAKAIEAANTVSLETKPFVVSTKLVTSFPKNPNGVPVICKVDSEELHALHTRLKSVFDSVGVTYSKKFPVFSPHITLAYADESPDDQSIPEVSFTVGEFHILSGNKGEDKIEVRFPLSMNMASALRVAARYQLSGPSVRRVV